jgi:hypothetical protein
MQERVSHQAVRLHRIFHASRDPRESQQPRIVDGAAARAVLGQQLNVNVGSDASAARITCTCGRCRSDPASR